MLRFDNHEDLVEIDLAVQETDDLRSLGDVYLTIRISSGGFTGHNDLWVLAPALRSFCQALTALENSRRGEAVLESISPEELRLVVRSVDPGDTWLLKARPATTSNEKTPVLGMRFTLDLSLIPHNSRRLC